MARHLSVRPNPKVGGRDKDFSEKAEQRRDQ